MGISYYNVSEANKSLLVIKNKDNKNMNIEYKKIKNDINGNPRYVIHFMNLLSDKDWESLPQNLSQITNGYALAIKKAKKIGGSKYRGKDFGGGIVFQSFNIESTIKDIKGVNNV